MCVFILNIYKLLTKHSLEKRVLRKKIGVIIKSISAPVLVFRSSYRLNVRVSVVGSFANACTRDQVCGLPSGRIQYQVRTFPLPQLLPRAVGVIDVGCVRVACTQVPLMAIRRECVLP